MRRERSRFPATLVDQLIDKGSLTDGGLKVIHDKLDNRRPGNQPDFTVLHYHLEFLAGGQAQDFSHLGGDYNSSV